MSHPLSQNNAKGEKRMDRLDQNRSLARSGFKKYCCELRRKMLRMTIEVETIQRNLDIHIAQVGEHLKPRGCTECANLQKGFDVAQHMTTIAGIKSQTVMQREVELRGQFETFWKSIKRGPR